MDIFSERGVDESADALAHGGVDKGKSSFVIHAAKAVIGAARHGRDSGNNSFDAGASRKESIRTSQITVENFHSRVEETLGFWMETAATGQSENLVTALLEFEGNVSANKAGRTCNENDHDNLRRKLNGSCWGRGGL
jgi:hypothetical protein